MKFFIPIIFLFAFSLSFAQTTWPPTSSVWYYQTYDGIGIWSPITYQYMTIEVNGDTVIKGKNCRILEKNYHSSYGGGCSDNDKNEYVYNDSNKVYLYNQVLDTFSILYDFGAKQYDTIKSFLDSCQYSIIIDSLSEIIVNQDTLTVFHTSSYDLGFTGGRIIEGIGDIGYLFHDKSYNPCEGYWCDGAGIGGLRCYSDSIIGHFETGLNDCEATVIWSSDRQNNTLGDFFKVYPNPTSNYLFVKSEIYKGEFLIYNLNGQLIHSNQLTNGINKIDLTKIESGLYLYKVSGELKSGKILIQR